jgi:hypothetical protein
MYEEGGYSIFRAALPFGMIACGMLISWLTFRKIWTQESKPKSKWPSLWSSLIERSRNKKLIQELDASANAALDAIKAERFSDAQSIIATISHEPAVDFLNRVVLKADDNLLGYEFIAYLIRANERDSLHYSAYLFSAFGLMWANGSYVLANYHLQKAVELDPCNAAYRWNVIVDSEIPEGAVTREELCDAVDLLIQLDASNRQTIERYSSSIFEKSSSDSDQAYTLDTIRSDDIVGLVSAGRFAEAEQLSQQKATQLESLWTKEYAMCWYGFLHYLLQKNENAAHHLLLAKAIPELLPEVNGFEQAVDYHLKCAEALKS